MTNLIKNDRVDLYYLSLYDEKELEYVLTEENKIRQKENLSLLTMDDIRKREVIVSKKDNNIDGYSITNLTFDSNKDVHVLIERLHENNVDDKYLNNALFEAAIFVAVEKVKLMKNNNNEIPKILSSSVIINGQKVSFNITEEYIKRNLGDKFNKEAVKQKIEQDEQFKKERQEVEDKVSANTFYNETGHRFHSNIDDKTNELSVIENDYDTLSLHERLVSLQQENLGSDKKLDEIYQDFEKEKISVDLKQSNTFEHKDVKDLDESHKDLITAASIIDKTDEFKIDTENGIAFDKGNNRINLIDKKDASEKLGNNIMSLVECGYSKTAIINVLNRDNVEWKNLSSEDKERILELYGVTDNNIAKENIEERSIDVHNSKDLDPQVKRLVLKNNQAAFASYVVVSFISGLSAGIFITLLLMFLRK